MAFTLFTELDGIINTATETYITDVSTNAIATATPAVVAGLMLTFVAIGILTILGTVQMPIAEFLKRSMGVAIICSIALAGGFYQSDLAGAIITLPNDLSKSLITAPTDEATAATMIDDAAAKGFARASDAFSKAGVFAEHGFVYAIYGVLIIATTAIVVGLGGAYILLAKVMLVLLVGLGPLFILALLWRPLSGLFNSWVGQVLSYVLLSVLVSALFGLMIKIFSTYLAGLKLDGSQGIGESLGGACILSVVMIVVLLWLPKLAAGLAGGVSISYLWELRAMKGGAQTGYAAGKAAVNNPMTRAAARSMSNAGGGVDWGHKPTANLYKGKKAA